MSESDAYGSVGAYLYDIAFDWRRSKEADFLETCLGHYDAARGQSVLDLACGTGKFLEEMVSRGWTVAGLDISPEMISLARKRLGEAVSLSVGDMTDFSIPRRVDVATCWYDSITYLRTNDEIIRHFRSVGNALNEGGLYLVDLSFSGWASSVWQQAGDWKPDFSNGWTTKRGQIELYHDGCEGPPCDPISHLITEYFYFRKTDQASGEEKEYRVTATKRVLHPQEFRALVSAAGNLQFVDWFTAKLDLSKKLEAAEGKGRGLVLLRKLAC